MEQNSILFVDRSDSGDRQFVPGFVVRQSEESMLVSFEDEMGFEVNDMVTTHRQSDEEFLEQIYQITRIINGSEGVRYEFVPDGTSKAGGSRRAKRIPTIYESLMATFGSEPDCPVLDMGENGISLIASQSHAVGDTTSFEMWIQDGHYEGTVTIQNIEPSQHDRIRYGLECNPDEDGQNLCESISTLWVALQLKCLENIHK